MANLAATNAMSCDQVAMDNSESGSFQSNEVRLLKYGWIHTMKMRKVIAFFFAHGLFHL